MITQIETRAGGIEEAYTLLGVSRSAWYGYRSGTRPVPLYIERSIRAHLALSHVRFSERFRYYGDTE